MLKSIEKLENKPSVTKWVDVQDGDWVQFWCDALKNHLHIAYVYSTHKTGNELIIVSLTKKHFVWDAFNAEMWDDEFLNSRGLKILHGKFEIEVD